MLLATNILALGFPILLGKIIDVIKGDAVGEITTLALFMIGFAVATASVRIASRLLIFNSARDAEFDLRNDLLEHLLTLDQAYYSKSRLGDTLSRVTNDVQTIRALWGVGYLNLLNTLFTFVTKIAFLLSISPMLTLIALLPYSTMIGVGKLFGKFIYKSSKQVQVDLGTLSAAIQEHIAGIEVAKTYTLEEVMHQEVSDLSETLLGSNMKLVRIRGLLVPVLSAISSMSAVILLWWGGKAHINGEISLGEFTAFSAVLVQLVWPTLALGWMLSLIQRGKAAWSRLTEIFDASSSLLEGDRPVDSKSQDVHLKNLSLTLGGEQILKNISLTIPAGTTAAIVGKTGCGKTSLLQCIARVHPVDSGALFYGDTDLTTTSLSAWRTQIGYSPQDAFLFSRSIADNVSVGLRAGDASSITNALAQAGLSGDLDAFPEGIDTIVGERGITLSGGQRQRVALARALVTKPQLLLLDDSLSAVDAETEQTILKNLEKEFESCTSIIVSHRVAAIKRCNPIFVMSAGEIVETGTHEALLELEGEYASIYQSQFDPDEITGESHV